MATTDPDEPTTAPTTPLPDAAAAPAAAAPATEAPAAATVPAQHPVPAHPTWYRPFSWAAFGIGAATVAVLVALLGGGVAIGFAISHHETRTSEVSPFSGNGRLNEQGGTGNGTGNGQYRFRPGQGDGTQGGTQNAPGSNSTPGASNG